MISGYKSQRPDGCLSRRMGLFTISFVGLTWQICCIALNTDADECDLVYDCQSADLLYILARQVH